MKRWAISSTIAVLAALAVLLQHSAAASLLTDTDTRVLLETVKAKNAPFSWFWSDWPLYNHFYRPLPTLLFELDQHLYGTNAAGYGWTNSLLAALSTVCLFWFLRELTDRPIGAALGTILFAIWQGAAPNPLPDWVTDFAWITLIGGAIRHRKLVRNYLPAFLVLLFFASELYPQPQVGARIIAWLPGRTASCMTIFALCSMAMYARYERLVPSFAPRRSSPLDLPATRTSQISEAKSSPLWAIGSALFAAGALASYEQGVMVPACLLGIAVYYRLLGQRPRWGWQALFWSLLIGYLWVRHSVIPPGESGYQKQQLRSSVAGGVMALTPLFFSPINALGPIITSIESGWLVLFTGQIYANLLTCVSGVTAVYQLRRDWVLALTGWALSILAFLPMAFLKMFEHYYYWPFALRTVFVIALGNVAWKLTSTAWSLPELQAPPRRSPAPGSLPHPSGYSPVS